MTEQTTAKVKLGKEDWIRAGFEALNDGGHETIRVEAMARKLGATKGSFYWHFKNAAALRSTMLQIWKERATADIIEGLKSLEPGRPRLLALIDIATTPVPVYDSNPAEFAIRDWARHDEEAAGYLREVDAKRITYLQEEMGGRTPLVAEKAHLFYAAYLGVMLLSSTTEQKGVEELHMLLDMVLDDQNS